jgi:hypothetical protein
LRKAAVLAQVIAKYPDFDPRAWLAELPTLDAFGVLPFLVEGQQLFIGATRAITERVRALYRGRMPTPRQDRGLGNGLQYRLRRSIEQRRRPVAVGFCRSQRLGRCRSSGITKQCKPIVGKLQIRGNSSCGEDAACGR